MRYACVITLIYPERLHVKCWKYVSTSIYYDNSSSNDGNHWVWCYAVCVRACVCVCHRRIYISIQMNVDRINCKCPSDMWDSSIIRCIGTYIHMHCLIYGLVIRSLCLASSSAFFWHAMFAFHSKMCESIVNKLLQISIRPISDWLQNINQNQNRTKSMPNTENWLNESLLLTWSHRHIS